MLESTEDQIKQFYAMSYDDNQVNELLNSKNLSRKDFDKWISGQTCSLIYKDGKVIYGYYKSDVDMYINYKKLGYTEVPIFD